MSHRRARGAKRDHVLEQRTAAVARVLRDWDPLGVQPGVDGPGDEYDGYAPALVERAMSGVGVDALAAHLGELRTQMLGALGDDASIAARILEAVSNPARHEPAVRAPKRGASDASEGSYNCPSCGEDIVVPLDPSEGLEQRYVEDCPVCCRANVIRVEYFDEGEPPRVEAEPE